MGLLLLQLTNLVMPAGAITQASEGAAASENIGFIVLGIILGPVLLLTIGAIIEFPRKSRIPELFLGSFFLLVSALIAGFAAIGFLLKFIVPQ